MILHITPDGMGGYYCCSLRDEMEGFWAEILGVAALLAGPLFTMVNFGDQLQFSIVFILLGMLLLYTPGNGLHRQCPFLVYTKAAVSVPLFYYGIASLAVCLAKAGNSIHGPNGLLVIMSALIMFVPVLALVVLSYGAAIPLVLLWPVTYIGASNGSALQASSVIMRIGLLAAPGIFIAGIIQQLRAADYEKGHFYFRPKLLGFALGCVPLAMGFFLGFLSPEVVGGIVLMLYPLLYFIYCGLLRQPSLFADWLLYPFLLSACCYVIVSGSMSWAFPSDLVQSIRAFLSGCSPFCMAGHRICLSFAALLTQIVNGIARLFVRLISSSASVPWLELSSFWGFVGMLGSAAVLTYGVGKYMERHYVF